MIPVSIGLRIRRDNTNRFGEEKLPKRTIKSKLTENRYQDIQCTLHPQHDSQRSSPEFAPVPRPASHQGPNMDQELQYCSGTQAVARPKDGRAVGS